MATRFLQLTAGEIQNLGTSVSPAMDDDTEYTVWAAGSSVIYLFESPNTLTAPPTDGGYALDPDARSNRFAAVVTPRSGESIYVWARQNTRVGVTDA